MGRVLSNNVGLAYNIETSLGVAGTEWFQIEQNQGEPSAFGADVTKTPRNPVSRNRQRRKGSTTDLDSTFEFEQDLVMSGFQDFVEGFVFATAVNAEMDIPSTAAETTGDTYAVAALTAAQANKLEFVALNYASLIFGRGFTNAANNGLKEIDADIATSAVAVSVVENLVDEPAPPANARIEIAGLRTLANATGDFTWNWDSPVTGQATLTSLADITDFSQFGLTVGQAVHIGSPDGSGGFTNAFENAAANDMFGYATIVALNTSAIVFDNVDATLQFDDLVAPITAVDILFGKFVRNVATNNSAFLERSFQFEGEFPGLQVPTGDEYQYAKGNFCNSVTFNLPLTDKAGISFGFIGTDTDNPTTVRKTGASTAQKPLQTAAFNTSADIARLRITELDESGLSTDFKSLSITFNNNVTPGKVLGTLGAKFMSFGNFEVDIEAQMLFTDGNVIDRIRDNTTVALNFILKNDDGTIFVDVPALTMGGGGREFPENEIVLINTTSEAFEDPILETSIGISFFSVGL